MTQPSTPSVLSAGGARLLLDTDDATTWVLDAVEGWSPDATDALARALREAADAASAGGSGPIDLLVIDPTPAPDDADDAEGPTGAVTGNPLAAADRHGAGSPDEAGEDDSADEEYAEFDLDPRESIAHAAGWDFAGTTVVVTQALADLPADAGREEWPLTPLDAADAAARAQALARFSTPDDVQLEADELAQTDPSGWVLASDSEGEIGVLALSIVEVEEDGDLDDNGSEGSSSNPGATVLEGDIDILSIAPARRGGGLGRRLHAVGLARLRDAGAATYLSSLDAEDPRALAIAERNGAIVTLSHSAWVLPD